MLGARLRKASWVLVRIFSNYAEILSLSLSVAVLAPKMVNLTMKSMRNIKNLLRISIPTLLNLYYLSLGNQSGKLLSEKTIAWHLLLLGSFMLGEIIRSTS